MKATKSKLKINYSNWVSRSKWDNHKAAILIAGLDPDSYMYRENPLEKYYTFPLGQGKKGRYAKTLYEDIIPTWEALNFNRWINHPFNYINKALCKSIEIDGDLLKEIKKQFLNEAKHNINLKSSYPYLFESIETGTSDQAKCNFCSHNYSTKLLQLTGEAIIEYWANYQPGASFPKKENIVKWLKDREISDREAAAIDTIIRHESRKKGGNTKK